MQENQNNTFSNVVILVEDNEDMRRLLSEALQLHGYSVLEKGDGIGALEVLLKADREKKIPMLLVSDIRLPGLSGLELVRTVRVWNWKIPCILITAFGDEKTLNESYRFGATILINKPFDIDDFITVVRLCVETLA